MPKVSVLMVGLEPTIIDFTDPSFAAFPGMSAARVQAGLDNDHALLIAAGYDPVFCLVDYGATAGNVLRDALAVKTYQCVMIGAGVRLFAKNTPLFETLVNIVHAHAPHAKFCFNTNPTNSAAAVQRWFPTAG